MKLLLDTHVFIWWDAESDRLPEAVLTHCLDSANELYLSLVSLWEIQIKQQLGKLSLSLPLESLVCEQIEQNDLYFARSRMRNLSWLIFVESKALKQAHSELCNCFSNAAIGKKRA